MTQEELDKIVEQHRHWLRKDVDGWEEMCADLGVYHYRLFCDEAWKPIMPRGEVYSTQFTEMGWKSFSEIHKI